MIIKTLQISLLFLVGACCPVQDGDIDGSPSMRYFDARGDRVAFDPTGIIVDSLTNLARPDVPVVWEVTGAFDGTFPDPDQSGFLQVTSAGEYGFTEEGSRVNRLVVYYTIDETSYSDTITYDSRLEERRCGNSVSIDPVREVSGPRVDRFERATDFPGVLIFLRDTL